MSSTPDEKRWSELFSKLSDLSASHSELKTEIRENNNILESSVKKLNEQESRLLSVENNLARFEKSQRSKNIILFNLEDSDSINSNLFATIDLLFKDIGLQVPDLAIADIYRLGKNKGKRPVIIKFIAERWVKTIFSKLNELKNKNLFITNDRTFEERELRRQLFKKIQELRETGIKARIVNNKIEIAEDIVPVDIVMQPRGNFVQEVSLTPDGTSSTKNNKRGRPSGSTKEKKDLLGSNTMDSFLSPRNSLDLSHASRRLTNKKLKTDGPV